MQYKEAELALNIYSNGHILPNNPKTVSEAVGIIAYIETLGIYIAVK